MRQLLSLTCVLLIAAAADDSKPSHPFAEKGAPAGWVVRVWNDVSKPAPPEAKWMVNDDGILTGAESRETWLMSEQEYTDFELEVEFKIPPRGNSGVAL